MAQDYNALVLEILKQQESLKMSIFAQEEAASTIRHYSELVVAFTEIDKLSVEITTILNKTNKKGALGLDLIQGLQKTGQLLWDQLLTRQVKDRLKTTIIKELVLSLDEELIGIPWELLFDGKDFLCLKFNLGRLIKTKEQVSQPQYRSWSGKLKILILANPTNDLKSAYQEGIQIKNNFDRRRKEIAIDFKSTSIDTLYVKKSLREYDIVHFAGHCEYDSENNKNTGWLLNDGRFTTQDILALGQTLSLPTLVFSNACYSAKTTTYLMDKDYQEKTYSLASAFLFSGVRHYIGTIWKAEDPVSLVVAREFYTQLIKGESVGSSLRAARLRLIKEYGIITISWANYLLYGDPSFVFFKAKSKPAAIKFKRKPWLSKKRIAVLASAIAVLSLCIYLYIWLPTRNPSAYLLFLKSRKLYLAGQNQKVISLCENLIKKDPLFLSIYPLLGDTYQRLGKQDEALRCYFEYARFSEQRQAKNHLASAYIGIGWLYHTKAEYNKAFDFYNKAIGLSRESKDKLNEATAMRKLALWYIDKEDYGKAMELLLKSSEINRERQYIYEHRYNLACDYFDIALVFTDKEDFASAKEFYTKSQRLFEKMKLKNELSDYYFNLGEIYLYEKQYHEALDCYMRGLKIDQTQGNKANIASDYNMIGELYMEMDDLEGAEESFKNALSTCKEIDTQPELASTYYNLWLLYKKQGQKNKAKGYLRQSQEIYYSIDPKRYQEIKQEFLELNNPS